jgi:hypothetical protein
MLINSVVQQFFGGPVAFAASIATILTFICGAIFALLARTRQISLGPWKVTVSAPHLKGIAALFWAVSIPLAMGALTGIVFTINWIAGILATPISQFAATIATALMSGNLARDRSQRYHRCAARHPNPTSGL